MNLTPAERAAMVRDLESLAKNYKLKNLVLRLTKREIKMNEAMADNYAALASALKECLTFSGVA